MPTKTDTINHYLKLGWVILPTAGKTLKRPKGKDWPNADAETDPTKYRHGIYLVCGERSGVTAIDLDSEDWIEAFEAIIRKHPTPYATTPSGGRHILIGHRPGWTNEVRVGGSIDIRNDGGGIVVPSGGDDREWYDDLEPWSIPLADPEPYERLLRTISERPRNDGFQPDQPTGTSHLTDLLTNPPQGQGERSDWLVRVAGHLAPWIPFEDAWLSTVHMANNSLNEPLDAREVEETVGKLYQRDRSRSADPHSDFPWEISDGNLYLWKGQGKRRERELWCEPAPSIDRLYWDENKHPTWEVSNGSRSTHIRPRDIHNTQRLSIALGKIGVLLSPVGPNPPNGTQFQKWLQLQEAPTSQLCPHWGWNQGVGWVGIEGDAIGPRDYQPLIGQIDRPDLIEQIPTWQEDEIAAVFCAWIALQAAKGKIDMPIEPNLVLQGAAGSGKTRGIFAFGARLTGSKRAASGTLASMRDRLAGHRNGILVIDDHADLESNSTRLLELYRVSTSGEGMTLMAQDSSGAWSERVVPIVGSIMASGESLRGMANDRALRDRSIILEVPPAADRKSLLQPPKPQWADMLEVFRQCGAPDEKGAHELAGPFIRRILDAVDEIGLPTFGSGERVTTKLDLIRYGAKLWQAAYPHSKTYKGYTLVEAVTDWCQDQAPTSNWSETSLVRQILPALVDPSVGALAAVRIRDGGRVLFHPQRIERAWAGITRDGRSREVGSIDNILREVQVLKDEGHAEYGKVVKMAGSNARVWELSTKASEAVLEAAGVYAEEDE